MRRIVPSLERQNPFAVRYDRRKSLWDRTACHDLSTCAGAVHPDSRHPGARLRAGSAVRARSGARSRYTQRTGLSLSKLRANEPYLCLDMRELELLV